MIFNPVYGGASAPNLGEKTIVANGEYNASSDNLDGYSKVIANVPNTYAASDEGKVVSNGGLVPQTSTNIFANGTYDTTTNNEVVVNVSGSSPTLITKNITENGTYDAEDDNADGYSSVIVNVQGGGGGSTNVLSGVTDPSASVGDNGSIYLKYADVPSGALSYIRTNNVALNIALSNWTYRASDKLEFEYKNIGAHGNLWGMFINTVANTNALQIQYNMWSGRTCMNVRHNGTWSGDGNYGFDGPNNLTKYYKVTLDGSAFSIMSGSARGAYNTTEVSTSIGTTSDTDTVSPVLFPTSSNNTLNIEFYELRVYRGGDLIHHYYPVQDGLYDFIDNILCSPTASGATYGVALEPAITNAYAKVSSSWQDLIGTDIDDVNTGGGGGSQGVYVGTTAPTSDIGSDGDYYYERAKSANWVTSYTPSGSSGTTIYGAEFTANKNLTITALRGMCRTAKTGYIQIGTTSSVLAQTDSLNFTANTWQEAQLSSPVTLQSGTNYIVQVVVTSGGSGTIAYTQNSSDASYDTSLATYVRSRYGSYPGSIESGSYIGVDFVAEYDYYMVTHQYIKESGTWSQIA